jgi:WD40 repeat protein
MTTLKSYPSSLRCFAISSSGRLAATGTNFRTTQLWDTHLGDSQPTIEGHQNAALHIFFTPDGRFAVSCDTDDALRLWDVHTGKCLRALHSWPPNAKITGKTESSFTSDCSRLKIGSTLISTGLSLSPLTSPLPRQAKSARYTIEAPAGDWVVEISTGTKVLWLPADRRPFGFEAHNNIIAIGHRWGGVTFLVLDPEVDPRP